VLGAQSLTGRKVLKTFLPEGWFLNCSITSFLGVFEHEHSQEDKRMTKLFTPPSPPRMLVLFEDRIADQILAVVRQERPDILPILEAALTADRAEREWLAVLLTPQDGVWLTSVVKSLCAAQGEA